MEVGVQVIKASRAREGIASVRKKQRGRTNTDSADRSLMRDQEDRPHVSHGSGKRDPAKNCVGDLPLRSRGQGARRVRAQARAVCWALIWWNPPADDARRLPLLAYRIFGRRAPLRTARPRAVL